MVLYIHCLVNMASNWIKSDVEEKLKITATRIAKQHQQQHQQQKQHRHLQQ